MPQMKFNEACSIHCNLKKTIKIFISKSGLQAVDDNYKMLYPSTKNTYFLLITKYRYHWYKM